MTPDPAFHVKQYVAEVRTAAGRVWRVFTTGSDRHYLFAAVVRGVDTGLHVPVEKAALRRDVRRALARGWGMTSRRTDPC